MGFENIDKIFEDVLGKPSVFKSKETLYPEYIPQRLPHRENQLKMLIQYFRPILYNPGSISQRVFVHGPLGVGKTVTVRAFGEHMMRRAHQKGINLRYVHINCHRARTTFQVIQELAKHIGAPVPQRGLSALELYSSVLEFLDRENMYIIIGLDEFDYFVRTSGSDALYFFVRTYDEHPDLVRRVNFILISRSIVELELLDSATSSYLMRHIVPFKPYKSYELLEILKDRRDEAFWEGTVSDEVLYMISEAIGVDTGGDGNARAAIEILRLAGEAADYEGSGVVTLDHVRKAYAVEVSSATSYLALARDALLHMPLHQVLIYVAIIRALRNSGKQYVRMGDVEGEYGLLCELYGEVPRGHTQVYEYIKDLKQRGLIEAKASGKGYRGKSTLIGIVNAPLELLEEEAFSIIDKITTGSKSHVSTRF